MFRTQGWAIELDYAASLENPVDDRVSEILVVQHVAPRGERFVGGEDHRALLPMAIVDDMEEHVCSIGPVGEVPHFVDHNDRGMDISGERVGELPTTKCGRKVVDEFSGGDKQRVKSILNGAIGDRNRQVRFPSARFPAKYQTPSLSDEIRRERGAQ